MRRITIKEYKAELKKQGVSRNNVCFVCPACGTVQSADDLIKAGAGKKFEDVRKYLGFSCVGRFTGMNQPPKVKGTQVGCDWTLGGLLGIHQLVVITPDDESHPCFEIASPEQAQKHLEAKT